MAEKRNQLTLAEVEAKLGKTEKDRKFLWDQVSSVKESMKALELKYSREKGEWEKRKAELEIALKTAKESGEGEKADLASELRRKVYEFGVKGEEMKALTAINDVLKNQVEELQDQLKRERIEMAENHLKSVMTLDEGGGGENVVLVTANNTDNKELEIVKVSETLLLSNTNCPLEEFGKTTHLSERGGAREPTTVV